MTTLRVLEPYVASLHFGSPMSHAAAALVERVPGATAADPVSHRLKWIYRWPSATAYAKVIAGAGAMLEALVPAADLAAVVVDVSGVGKAVLDLLEQQGISARIEHVQVTSGERASQDASGWRCPQRDLIGLVQLLLGQGLLTLPRGLALTPVLVGQLDAWRVRARSRERLELEAEEDLAVALGLAAWYGQMVNRPQVEEDSDGPTYQEALRYEYDKRRIKGGPPKKPSGPMPEGI
jgi:hypothetical protein